MVLASLVNSEQDCSGQVVSGIGIATNAGTNGVTPSEASASVILLLPSDVKGIKFSLAERAVGGDITAFAYGTKIAILADGRPVKQASINKDDFLTTDIPVAIQGARQVTIEISTVCNAAGSDQYGPCFPVVLANVTLEK
jgi:hypothetical protein